jgi:hypothetical protein
LLVLGGLLHFDGIVNDKIHELIKPLEHVSGIFSQSRRAQTHPDFPFYSDR